jgi:N-methylhydantoinase A
VLAAAGLLVAPVAHELSAAFHTPLAGASRAGIAAVLAALDARAAALMARDGVPLTDVRIRHEADMAYVGQSHALSVPLDLGGSDPLAALARGFEAEHARINGHATGGPAKIVNLRTVHEARAEAMSPLAAPEPGPSLLGSRHARLWGMARAAPVPVHARSRLPPGARLTGPAILAQEDSTTLLPPGWTAAVQGSGALLLQHGDG